MKRLPARTADRVLAEVMAGLARDVSVPRRSPFGPDRRLLPRPRAFADQPTEQESTAGARERPEVAARRG